MKRFTKISTLILICFFTSLSISASDQAIKLQSGDVIIPSSNSSLIELKRNLNSRYSIIQFTSIPTEVDKAVLNQNGVELLEYIPNFAFIAQLKNVTSATMQSLNIKGAIPYTATFKLSKSISNQENPSWAINGDNIDLFVSPHLNVTRFDLVTYLNSLGAQFLIENSQEEYEEIRIPGNRLAELANSSIIKFIDYVAAPPEPEDQRGRTLHRGNMLDSDHPLGRKYDGTGVSIAIADDAQIGPHIDTKGRVTSFAVGVNGSHGDMTTGIAMGAGNLNPNYRGMATGAFLYYYDINGYPHISQAVNNLNTRGVVITSTSYSEGCNAGYTTTTRSVDQQVRQNPTLLHVFSAGNSSGSTCGANAYGAGTPWGTITGGRKQGKSSIATGNLFYTSALTASSSRGPAADGRIKPDICANGTNQMSTEANNTYQVGGGTSAASPGIAGLAAQMYHGYRTLNGGANPESGLIKSAMLNTARDIGNVGPDFTYGWGRVNAHRAMLLLEDGRYSDSTISQNGINIHTITIPANTEELKFMLYWTDFEASTASAISLVNNLDFKVITPLNDTISPWILNSSPNAASLSTPATRGIDNLNNIEQVEIDSITAGVYTLLVDGKVIPQGPQKYYITWESRTADIDITYPSGGESFTPNSTETIRWDAPIGTGATLIQFSTDNGTTWTTIGNTNNTGFRYWNWNVPSIVSGQCLIRVTNNGNVGVSTNHFSIIGRPTNLRTDFICPDSTRLTWDTVPGALSYEISQLGATHMDSIGTATSNGFMIYNLTLSDDNWFAVKAIGSTAIGKRTLAIQIGKAIDNCPFSFDIEVERFLSPLNSFILNCGSNKIPVTVSLRNNGDSTLMNVPLRMRVAGTLFNDTLVGPFMGNTIQSFTFKDSLSFTSSGNVRLDVITNLSNDQNNLNDSLGVDLNVLGTSFTLPYTQNFETFSNCGTASDCGATVCNLIAGWYNEENGTSDDFDLRVDAGGTPSNGTGPSIDHNPGTVGGKYLYSEASGNGACFNASAVTITPCFDLTNTLNPEFSFWYHMNGTAVGSIRVDVHANGLWTNNITSPIIGSKGNTWLKETISMSSYVGQIVNFRITVTTGNSWSSDIAIDDVAFIDQPTSINEISTNDLFKVYPNPSTGLFTIAFSETPQENIVIRDISGRIIEEKTLSNSKTQIDLSNYAKGVYFLTLKNTAIIEKLIVY